MTCTAVVCFLSVVFPWGIRVWLRGLWLVISFITKLVYSSLSWKKKKSKNQATSDLLHFTYFVFHYCGVIFVTVVRKSTRYVGSYHEEQNHFGLWSWIPNCKCQVITGDQPSREVNLISEAKYPLLRKVWFVLSGRLFFIHVPAWLTHPRPPFMQRTLNKRDRLWVNSQAAVECHDTS